MTEKPTKKIWYQIITRDLKTIDIDLQKAIKLSKDRDLHNEMVVERVNKLFLYLSYVNS